MKQMMDNKEHPILHVSKSTMTALPYLIHYMSACRVTLATTVHVTHGTISHVRLRCAQRTTNIQATETHAMNAHTAQTHV